MTWHRENVLLEKGIQTMVLQDGFTKGCLPSSKIRRVEIISS